MIGENHPDAVREYFASHAIDEEIAAHLGVVTDSNTGLIAFKYVDDNSGSFYRERWLPEGKVRQPAGRHVVPWVPLRSDGVAGSDGVLLVCEGESDCLAAISALYELDGDEETGERWLQRRRDLPPPVAELVPVAIPGANSAHEKIADLAENEVVDVWIALDGDPAGRTNAEKLAAKINKREHISAGVLPLPDGKDLAGLLAAADDPVDALANLIAEAEAAAEAGLRTDDHAGDKDDGARPAVDPLPPEVISGLLDRTLSFLDRYVVLPGDHERFAVALWVAHTYTIEAAHATPYLLIVSPEKRSGKTRLLESLELLVDRPWRVTGASEAAMFRKIAKDKPAIIDGERCEVREPLEVHHVNGDPSDDRPVNRVPLCKAHHREFQDQPDAEFALPTGNPGPGWVLVRLG